MKAWTLIDFKKVEDLLDAYDTCQRLANQFQMFDTYNVTESMAEIREAIRLEVDGKVSINGKGE